MLKCSRMIYKKGLFYSYFLTEHMYWIFVDIASLTILANIQNKPFFKYELQHSCVISDELPPLEQKLCATQIIIVTNFFVALSECIKRVDCICSISH